MMVDALRLSTLHTAGGSTRPGERAPVPGAPTAKI